jgi:hypothetical protein
LHIGNAVVCIHKELSWNLVHDTTYPDIFFHGFLQ